MKGKASTNYSCRPDARGCIVAVAMGYRGYDDKDEPTCRGCGYDALTPTTARFYSSKDGWEDLGDQLIDASITGALESLQSINYKRERIGNLYRYTLSLPSPVGMQQDIGLGSINYRRIHKGRVALGLKSTVDVLRNKALRSVLEDAANYAKLRVDKEHNVGTFASLLGTRGLL